MGKPVKFTIPQPDVETLVSLFKFPVETKNKLFEALNTYTGELTNRGLIEHLSNHVDLDTKILMGISDVYFGFIHSNNAYQTSNKHFVGEVKRSISLVSPDFQFGESEENDVVSLLVSGKHSLNRLKILELKSENPINYDESKITQNLRTVFDDNGEVIGSVVVHNLKISIFGREKERDYFITMDKSDLESLAEEIKKALETEKRIESTYTNAKFFEL